MKERLKTAIKVLFVLAVLTGCGWLTYLLATGAWSWLVTTVTSLISQGPAAVISAILVGLFSWYCLIPLAVFIVMIVLMIWAYSR